MKITPSSTTCLGQIFGKNGALRKFTAERPRVTVGLGLAAFGLSPLLGVAAGIVGTVVGLTVMAAGGGVIARQRDEKLAEYARLQRR
ncbi:MAG: hypothetical protein CMH30_07025 [Micavibrio sp.]|nr:hypothetical protein [Micavibrio sp.]|tara:strand:+ start:345 stop:605 length:261 start_codon:yes stop_codon:yes gene_type:complete